MHIQKSVYTERLARLQELMEKSDVASVIIPPGPNFFYLTGFETESMERLAAIIVTGHGIIAICPDLMKEQLLANSWIDEIRSWNDAQDPYSMIKNLVPRGRVAIDGSLPYMHYARMHRFLAGEDILADDLMAKLRIMKDEHEISAIAEAVRRSEAALQDTIETLVPGMTEISIARRLEEKFAERGLQGPAFQTIVASGPNSSIPHHVPGNRKLDYGDILLMDFGGRYNGYASDITRTFFLGNVPESFREIYEAVRDANETARGIIAPGVEYQEMDAAARKVISGRGFGKFFIHRLGHGLGISVHEDPYLVAGNTSMVQENAVFTIEPGIYIQGKGGVRIEDTNRFDGKSCTAFNGFTRDLTVI